MIKRNSTVQHNSTLTNDKVKQLEDQLATLQTDVEGTLSMITCYTLFLHKNLNTNKILQDWCKTKKSTPL